MNKMRIEIRNASGEIEEAFEGTYDTWHELAKWLRRIAYFFDKR